MVRVSYTKQRVQRESRRVASRPASHTQLGLYSDLMPTTDRRFGEQTSMFKDLSQMGLKRGVQVVVLTPGYSTSHRGWRLIGDSWVNAELPLPGVVLRRSGTFQQEVLRDVETDLKLFRRSGRLHTLPRACGNKWTILSLFRQSSALRGYVPETVTAASAREVFKCLRRLGDVYVKPLAGAQGVSVYRLSGAGSAIRVRYERRNVPRQTERLTNQFDPGTTLMERTYPSEQEFTQFWKSVRLQKCIVQETIQLPSFPDGRPFDFRWLVQYTDRPTIIARVARVGRPYAVTTNIHTGGTAMTAEEALRTAGVKDGKKLIETLDLVALYAAECLKERYGPYAEVGIDLACRPDGSVVIFEVNPTPGRRMLRALGQKYRQLSLECLLEYAIRATR